MSQDRLEAVAAFSYLHEAEFARTSLESEGIVTVIENENLIRRNQAKPHVHALLLPAAMIQATPLTLRPSPLNDRLGSLGWVPEIRGCRASGLCELFLGWLSWQRCSAVARGGRLTP